LTCVCVCVCVCVVYAVAELAELKQRMRAAEVEAGSLRRQLMAAADGAKREVQELEELRRENRALKGQQGAVQKVGRCGCGVAMWQHSRRDGAWCSDAVCRAFGRWQGSSRRRSHACKARRGGGPLGSSEGGRP
jgi:hypothetical protein